MTECPATAQVINGTGDDAELFCCHAPGHTPPIHWDKQVGVHWFRMEEISGTDLVSDLPASNG